jgi:hypothetical protein
MKRIILALTLASSLVSLAAVPAGATECTPKGCTGGCHLNGGSIEVDPTNPTIGLERPIECYS